MSLATEPTLGLRQRKKVRTQRAIIRATAELTLESGFTGATIARIAERADVSPRTVSVWFPVKEDILFGPLDDQLAHFEAHLRNGEGDIVDRVDTWLAAESERLQIDTELASLGYRAILSDDQLRAREVTLLEPFRIALADAAGRELGESARSSGPQLFATATMGFLLILRTRLLTDILAPSEREAGLAFLRAGLAALRR